MPGFGPRFFGAADLVVVFLTAAVFAGAFLAAVFFAVVVLDFDDEEAAVFVAEVFFVALAFDVAVGVGFAEDVEGLLLSILPLTLSTEDLVRSAAVCVNSRARLEAASAAFLVSPIISTSAVSDLPPSGDKLSLMRKIATAISLTKRMMTNAKRMVTKNWTILTIVARIPSLIDASAVEKKSSPQVMRANQKKGITNFSFISLSKEKKKSNRFFTVIILKRCYVISRFCSVLFFRHKASL